MTTDVQKTTCVVVGGGPAGMVLGLLLARAGVEVTVLEKHADFLRDFRGDTVHATTIRLMDELGLGARFRALPQSKLDRISFPTPDGGTLAIGDVSKLRAPYNYIAMVPQWDLLDLLADAGRAEPTFTLRMNTQVTEAIQEGGKVVGVRYRTADGATGELRADLTIGCDGRHSVLREPLGMTPHEYPVPFDTWWFRLPRHDEPGEISNLSARIRMGEFMIVINRDDYYQLAYFTKKGSDAALRAEGLDRFRQRIAELEPKFADRVAAITDFDQVKLLDVKLNRLHRWHTDGLLLIGDAAHAMSPIGGVGINLAVQDAVAAATILAEPLRTGTVTEADLAKVQRRRWLPMALIQGLQRILHTKVVGPTLSGKRNGMPSGVLWLSKTFPFLRRIPAYMIARGPRPEHAPDFARRDTEKVPA
ncbi:FAD-dependent oxidoreductase [Labedaea rhizosphaerae]|uniref:2-polyprenyl-6-methoxyphenol hydroxylase-like FAD-dependent oxidoreductase n=1 Tax=Labedaea rhizosphaerae TaxID=598644 RepID=A0A4V3CZ42_LABRH|nr:FAD-dependent oxidoreductase [Labedaea rhizosphaerae]TDP96528.1 2-polyprenyl-6-methoxyphenol hydroxylase-like FAD-dependent oxidoreductase [Labedaea rhizosphaerae]